MTLINIRPVAPGQAELEFEPWEDEAAGVELCIQRSEGDPYLDPDSRSWTSDQRWIALQGARVEDGKLRIHVQPNFVDTLLDGVSGRRLRAHVRVAGGAQKRFGVHLDPLVLHSSAAGAAPAGTTSTSTIVDAGPPSAAQEPKLEPAAEQSTTASQAPPQAPAQANPAPQEPDAGKPSRLPMLLGLLALLVVLAIAAYFFLLKKPAGVDAPPPAESGEPAETPAEPTAQAEPSALACSAAALAEADAMSFVQACVREMQDSAQLLGVIQAARDQGKCEIAQRLYANRANSGDNVIAMAYAQEYDPAASSSNACFTPEAATARYWYETVLEREPEHAEARARLDALAP